MSTRRYTTPEAAEAAFYAAFEAHDFDAMMDVWHSDSAIVCIHPLAAPLDTHAAIAAGWRSLFEAAGQFRLQVELAHELHEANQVVRIVREYLTIGQSTEPRAPILATNIYRHDASGWHMVLHHASPMQAGAPARTPTPTPVLH
ncbi:MAG: nuclear transport factor 2 family protein [Thiobacillus sp.]